MSQQPEMQTCSDSALVDAARAVLRDCPQGEPVATYYANTTDFAVARALWKVACTLRPALVQTTGSAS